MSKERIILLRRCVILSLLFVGCNRPVPTKVLKEASATTTPEPLLLTRTSIAGHIIGTLTAIPLETEPLPATAALTLPPDFPSTSPTPSQPVSATPAAVAKTPTAQPSIETVESAQSLQSIPNVVFLHKGEFPWCLARRYNIHPNQIMAINGFFAGQYYYSGQPVYLPANPLPYPGSRALRPHPTSHLVRPGETIYIIACYYGDVDPDVLAERNGLSPSDRLTPGMSLAIP